MNCYKRQDTLAIIGVLLVGSVGVGCTNGSPAGETMSEPSNAVESNTDSPSPDDQSATSEPPSANLPGVSIDALCENYTRPTVAEWALGGDSVVIGTIESVEPGLDPLLSSDNAAEPLEIADCDLENFNPALLITLTDVEAVHGRSESSLWSVPRRPRFG